MTREISSRLVTPSCTRRPPSPRLGPDRLALLLKEGLRPKAVTYYYRELDDAYSDGYATCEQLVFAARGRTYVLSFFKGREPTAAAALALIAAGRARP